MKARPRPASITSISLFDTRPLWPEKKEKEARRLESRPQSFTMCMGDLEMQPFLRRSPALLACLQYGLTLSPSNRPAVVLIFAMFSQELASIRRMGVRAFLVQTLNFITVLTSALAMWKGLSFITDTESPVVVVLSGSMEPAFYRGDLLFLSKPTGPFRVGDITVYKVPGGEIPIVHRVLEVHDV